MPSLLPRTPRPFRAALAATALLAAAGAASAQTAFTLYGGARSGGGKFQDVATGSTYELDAGPVVGASVDWPLGDGRIGQVYLSHQRSGLSGRAFGEPTDVTVDVTHLHLGGRAFFEGDPKSGGGYVVGGIGASLLSPSAAGYSDELRASGNVGVGWQWALAPSVALRAELRGYLVLINASGGFFCSGGCVVSIRGETMTQVEGLVGLSFGF
jgi:hypothetical protein